MRGVGKEQSIKRNLKFRRVLRHPLDARAKIIYYYTGSLNDVHHLFSTLKKTFNEIIKCLYLGTN